VSTDLIRQYISDPKVLELLYEDSYAVWGITNGGRNVNKNKWETMERGDVCLVYRDRHFFSAAKILCKFNNRDFSIRLWNTKENSTPDNNAWENMFLMDEIKKINIPILSFNKFMKYSDNFILQSYQKYEPDVTDNIMEEFSLQEWDTPSLISNSISEEENRNRILTALKELHNTDDLSPGAKGRKEQTLLREHLVGNSKETKCSLCHKVFPNNLMIAAHIKPRRDCSEEERKDLNVVMPVCKIGCDDLYEKGYILVDESGQILKNQTMKFPSELDSFVNQYLGKKCTHHNENTKKYFEKRK
tara:strand:+ start:496 stop:1401 length:906 start_codon:yes stop_codon:yes gene_type:complete